MRFTLKSLIRQWTVILGNLPNNHPVLDIDMIYWLSKCTEQYLDIFWNLQYIASHKLHFILSVFYANIWFFRCKFFACTECLQFVSSTTMYSTHLLGLLLGKKIILCRRGKIMKNWGKTVKKWSKNASILDPIYRGEIDFPNLNIPVQHAFYSQ